MLKLPSVTDQMNALTNKILSRDDIGLKSVTAKVGAGPAHFRKSKIPCRISFYTEFN